jgi:hypothetical protein
MVFIYERLVIGIALIAVPVVTNLLKAVFIAEMLATVSTDVSVILITMPAQIIVGIVCAIGGFASNDPATHITLGNAIVAVVFIIQTDGIITEQEFAAVFAIYEVVVQFTVGQGKLQGDFVVGFLHFIHFHFVFPFLIKDVCNGLVRMKLG